MPEKKGESLTSAVFFAGATLYFFAISIVSHIPGNALENLGWNVWDKAAHVVEYAPLGLLLTGGLAYRSKPLKSSSLFFVGFATIAVLGALDEFHQSFVPGRFATFSDAVADVIGGCVGIGLGMRLLPNRSRSRRT